MLWQMPPALQARTPSPLNLSVNFGIVLVQTTTLAAARTVTFDNDELTGLGLLSLYVTIFDADDSETGVSIACTAEHASGGNSYRVPACPWDTVNLRFNCEAGPMFWNPSDETSADTKRQLFRVDIENMTNSVCTFTFTGGAAGDRIEVVAYGSVK